MHLNKLSKHVFCPSAFLPMIGFTLIVLSGAINIHYKKPFLKVSKQETAININKDLLRYISAGNKRLMTDLLWIQTLIESDLDHYNAKDLNNWLFLRFNTISTLDPRFYENYLFGGQFLAIAKDDLDGANEIYRKGIKYYPNDYQLNYHAGFLNYYEIGDFKQGLQYLEKIKDHPKAPAYIQSIINKLQYEISDDPTLALKLLHQNYTETEEITLKNKLARDIYSLKAQIDLNCLNSGKKDCERKDAEGNPYLFSEGKYHSLKQYAPYRLFRNR